MTGRHVPVDSDDFARPRPPWWSIHGDSDAGRRAAERGRAAGLEVRTLAGERLRTAGSLFVEFADAWNFPGYFGHNWSALEDCLLDLSWTPARGYLCVVTGAGHLLREEQDGVVGLFLDLLVRVGASWATPVAEGQPWDHPALPFHTVFSARSEVSAATLWARAGAGGADLRAGA